MSFEYRNSQANGQLEQGEILLGVYEHRVRFPASEPPQNGLDSPIDSIKYKYTVILNPACDLEQDFKFARFGNDNKEIREPERYIDGTISNWIPHVILLEASDSEDLIKSRLKKPDLWQQVQQNDHKRYHRIPTAKLLNAKSNGVTELPTFYLDFKKPIAIPCVGIYEGIRTGKIQRLAVLPTLEGYDLIQRYISFFGRVGLP